MLTLKNDFDNAWTHISTGICVQTLHSLGFIPQNIFIEATNQKENFLAFCNKYHLPIE